MVTPASQRSTMVYDTSPKQRTYSGYTGGRPLSPGNVLRAARGMNREMGGTQRYNNRDYATATLGASGIAGRLVNAARLVNDGARRVGLVNDGARRSVLRPGMVMVNDGARR